jgi:tetratricopeptide (TPR) repeat protein
MIQRWRKMLLLLSLVVMPSVMVGVPAVGALQRLQVGMEAPDFSLKGPAGGTVKFADLKGDKLTAVVFWSTWSRKSPAVLTRMQQLAVRYRDKGFRVVAINADGPVSAEQGKDAAGDMAAGLKLDYPIFRDQGLTTFNEFGIIALPSTIILDASRIIRYELSGFPLEGAEEMADYLAESLEGKKRSQAVKAGHQPDKAALRFFNMGTTSLKSKRTADDADAWFRKAVEADPEFLLPRLALGKFYAQRGDRPKARKELEQVLTREPKNMVALCELGLIAANDGKLEEARGLIDTALGIGIDYPACYAYGGYVYGRLGNLERALQLHDEAARLSPWDNSLLLYRARTLEEHNRIQEAAAVYRQALEQMMTPP